MSRRNEGKKRPWLIALIMIVMVFVGGVVGVSRAYNNSLKAMDLNNTELLSVEIPEGASTDRIATILEEKELIHSDFFFKVYSKRAGYDGQYKHGTYELSKSMSEDEIMQALIRGASQDVKRFTIPEGYNITQVKNKLVSEGLVDEESFMNEIRNGKFDYKFIKDLPAGDERLEGFLYPETYEIFANEDAHGIIDRMLGQFDDLFKDEYYDKAKEMGYSVREIVTMASIIERESKTAEERPIMAGVFYNRLDEGMKLESCATIQYILGEPKEFLTYDDLERESPYNTYIHTGLPPGPICSPRMASIEAALYPDDNDYIFFVVSEKLDGTHNFSEDYSKFLKDKDAYNVAVANRKN